MAQLPTIDARSVTVQLEVTHLREVTWRIWLANWLLWLADKISAYDIRVIKDIGEPAFFYCRFCERQFAGTYIPGKQFFTIQCPHCKRQNPATSSSADGAWVINGPLPKCPGDYYCHFAEPYGFVPEDGCPIHDV